ncbi:nucleotidyltransferase substrate binding protein [Vibrio sp. SCSIO 43136]|uniref:nucleotidyltransferase substrate binding protein n=1 Tax=Vibrio sp. SCSIO 43136 TaxID=2819101 RepID=UPI0020762296|nr:nucleotidyltransferase substrate binding protein [Vibrio sp. SCSIO 43136]USD65095.1 nucleotidyltransferase substrate binding protein [Vibrio sp. SCSIO 43136]
MINTDFYLKCIQTLEKAHTLTVQAQPDSIEYEMFRSACVKEFEILLEQSGKLLKLCLRPYLHSHSAADKLFYKDIFRKAAQFGLLSMEEVERWLEYRDNRNNTAHDYGVKFADTTLALLPSFIEDCKRLESLFRQQSYD